MRTNYLSADRSTEILGKQAPLHGLSFIFVILALLFIAPRSVQAAAGDLDPTFGNGGVVQTDFSGGDDYGFGVKVQSDGKTVVVGESGVYPLFHSALTRYNRNGTLDRTFGTGGKVVAALDSGGDGSTAVTFQTDGKIVTAGSVIHNNFVLAFVTARFNSDGSLDQTFGSNGSVQTTFGDAAAEGNDVVLQGDGKIIVVGFTGAGSYSSLNNFALVRFNPDGTLDQSFGAGGKVKSARGLATSAVLQADGKIVVGGTYDTGSSRGFMLARYNSNGTLDGTFGNAGVTKTAIARYTSTGQLDQTFGTGGKVLTAVSNDSNGYALTIAGSKITLAGAVANSQSPFDFGVARYLAR